MHPLFAVANIWLFQVSNYNPGPNPNIPGFGSIMDIVNTVGAWGIAFAILGLILSVVITVLGRTAGNGLAFGAGIAGLVMSGLAAAFIGGAGIWVNHLTNFGAAWH